MKRLQKQLSKCSKKIERLVKTFNALLWVSEKIDEKSAQCIDSGLYSQEVISIELIQFHDYT